MLPCEIWKHEISSYLDTESRINLSRILNYDCRPIPKKFTNKEITRHFAQSTCSALKSKLEKIIKFKKISEKIVFVMEYFKLIQKKPIFCTILSEEIIREILLEKCEKGTKTKLRKELNKDLYEIKEDLLNNTLNSNNKYHE